ncbi:MAG: FG-GAP-like repeat-containing protein [Planctomycetota bacterium]
MPDGPVVLSTPLPSRAVVGGKRFARLDSGETGLVFRNELRRENTVAYVYMGAGLTVGDYDQDGLPDVYLVSQDGENRLFRQTAPLRFEDVTASVGQGLDGGSAWGTAASFADVDGDGDLDLYVCNLESPNLLFVNEGGRFVEKAGMFGLGVTAASTGVAFADYDNDGDLDLYLLTNRVFRPTLPAEIVAETTPPSAIAKSRSELLQPDLTFGYRGQRFMAGQRDRLFRNDGYATFVDATDDAKLDDHGNGLSVVWWDFDDDGLQDIYVANDFQSPDLLWRNKGDGTFEDVTKRLPHTAFFGMGCDFGDVDLDGRMDLCVADMSSTTHYMGKMLMGSMDQHRWFLMNAEPQQYMRNALYVNSGTEKFLECAHMAGLASTDWTWTVRFADLDEDGRQDFYATNGIPVFADNPDIGERVRGLWQQKRYAAAMDVLRNMPRVDEKNIARRNVGDLKFEDVGELWGLDQSGVTHGAVVVDLDRDGDLDVITNNFNAEASVFENRTAGTNRLLVELRGVTGNAFGVGAKLEVVAGGVTQVRQVSLTRGYMSAGEAVEHFGLGDATQVEEVRVRWPDGSLQVVRDQDANCRLRIRKQAQAPAPAKQTAASPRWFEPVAASSVDLAHKEADHDDFVRQPLLPHRLSRLGPGVAVGLDKGEVGVWLGGAVGSSGRLAGRDVPAGLVNEDMGAVFVDYDSDGDLDLYVASGGIEADEGDASMRDRLYANTAEGFVDVSGDVFTGNAAARAISSSCVCAADYDRDGDVDLFVGGRVVPGGFPRAPASRLLRNDNGKYVDVSAAVAPSLSALGMVSSACWSDIDGDGYVDLCVAAQWQPVRVLANVRGMSLEDRTDALGLRDVRGQWNGITSADLDGDGDFDLVVTNLGLNTKYKASREKPMELFARDFDGNGTFDVVEAKRSGKDTLPVRGLSCSSQAMPFVREKFSTYDAFARATLGEIYGKALDDSLALTCNELRHVVLENRGEQFVLHALPSRAQLSTSFGVVARDFDGDGLPEIVLGHNSWSPEPETGRSDGGLGALLKWREGFAYEAVEPAQSGIVNSSDCRGVAFVAGLRGPGELLFVTNNGAHRRMRSARTDTAKRRIALVGGAGNPCGYGARLTFESDGQRPIVRQVLAGDGYLTQSSPVVDFPLRAGTVAVVWPDGVESRHELDGRKAQVMLRR